MTPRDTLDGARLSHIRPVVYSHHLFLTRCIIASLASLIGFLCYIAPVQAHAGHAQPDLPYPLDGLIRDVLHCGGDFLIKGTDLCTHGPDFEIPEGPQVAPPPITCEGDGVSGKRVQVLYVRELLSPDNYAENLALFRRVAADVNRIFDDSAHQTGGHLHIRFVTNSACEIDVQHVVVPPLTDMTFTTLLLALKVLGYNDPDRKYLMFVDADVYCGIATVIGDSRPGADNKNNHQAGFARVDRGCWWGTAAAHELVHTLGGVQKDSPNTSGGWHCTDEWDIMCYSDSPHYPVMSFRCSNAYDALLDCNHDDYFHTSPPPDSYLAAHWNVANSAFLLVHNLPPTVKLRTASGGLRFQQPATITLVADAKDSDGAVTKVEFFTDGVLLATVNEAPFQLTWFVPTSGRIVITANVYDDRGAVTTSEPLAVVIEEPNTPPIIRIETLTGDTVFDAPAAITVLANTSDPDGEIAQVEFFDGAALLGVSVTAPYSITWLATTTETYTITARAFDNSGAQSTSEPLFLSVVDRPDAPVPISLATVAGTQVFTAPATVVLSAQVNDIGSSVTSVEFYSGTMLMAEDVIPPYVYAQTIHTAGAFAFTAKVYYDNGASFVSTPLRVQVAGPTTLPPEEALSPPTFTTQFGAPGTVTITAQILDVGAGVDRVEFYHELTLLGSDSTPPYRFIWTNVSVGTYRLLVKVYDINGNSATSSPSTIVVAPSGPPPPAPDDDPNSLMMHPAYLPLIIRPDG